MQIEPARWLRNIFLWNNNLSAKQVAAILSALEYINLFLMRKGKEDNLV